MRKVYVNLFHFIQLQSSGNQFFENRYHIDGYEWSIPMLFFYLPSFSQESRSSGRQWTQNLFCMDFIECSVCRRVIYWSTCIGCRWNVISDGILIYEQNVGTWFLTIKIFEVIYITWKRQSTLFDFQTIKTPSSRTLTGFFTPWTLLFLFLSVIHLPAQNFETRLIDFEDQSLGATTCLLGRFE